ncbi:endonuclease Q family protein [Patescibacteria group bacterium]|nr:endonuclease Q family protein [Patescibacteria group bacterium]MBU0963541.1 endonuclease Q family protein [Patescibacteria group bacterium]
MAEYIADIHAHSKYSRAVSKQMTLETMAEWADKKGIQIISCTDFTYPAWFKELKEKLSLQDNGLYKLKKGKHEAEFMLTTEISCIYKKNDKTRRVHINIIAPDLEVVEKINAKLNLIGNIKSDGRPILGLDVKELAKIVLEISPEALVFPAHIWTPWFSMFGSESGFDSVEECWEEMTPHIYAVETGLSSDPSMNWRISQLDRMSIVSFSDAHSPNKLGREATVFELEQLSYKNIIQALKQQGDNKNKIAHTVEFYPEEGRYHWDGHRKCNICLSPAETKKKKGICPKCKKPLTVGVSYRVDKLADRPEGYQPDNRPPYKCLVPLQEIIADAFNQGVNTKKVVAEYDNMINQGKNEFNILLNLPFDELKTITLPKIAEGVKKVRTGDIVIKPGYDGEYGIVKVFNKKEQKISAHGQSPLF